MPITTNTAGLIVPDVYIVEKEPPVKVTPRSTGVIGIVGQFTYGPVGEPISVGDPSELIRKTGVFLDGLDGHMAVLNMMAQGASDIKVVRVTDGTEAAASGVLANGATGVVTLVMEHPGTHGNTAKVTITNSTVTGYVDVSLVFNGITKEFKGVNMDADSDDYLVDKINEAGTFVTAVRTLTAGETTLPEEGTTTFSGGTDGTTVGDDLDDAEYVGTVGATSRTGLKVFETDDGFANIIVSARSTSTINTEVISQCSNTDLSPRMGVISPALGTSVTAAKALMATINTDYVVMVYPALYVNNTYTRQKELFPAAPFFAGLLSTLSPHVSPSRKQIVNVVGAELNLSRPEVKELIEYRIVPITVMPSLGFVTRAGITTSSNGGKKQIVRRRMINYFVNKWEPALQLFVSRGHTAELRNEIRTFFVSDLERDLRASRIGNASGGPAYSVKCDSQNNPPEIVQANQLVVDIAISLIAPADILIINIDASEENTRISA